MVLMLKAWPLCISAEWNLGDRVLGEVEKNIFIASPGKEGTEQAHALKNCVPPPGRIW